MVITPLEIQSLAKIGRKYISEEIKQNIIHWIGHVPTDEEIDRFFEDLIKENPYFISEEKK